MIVRHGPEDRKHIGGNESDLTLSNTLSARDVRARTAISRTGLSRPLRLAVLDGLITAGTSVLDYGCGRGDDIRQLAAMGCRANGWDPVYRPGGKRNLSPVVNLGYVVNVIEDENERRDTLRQAWEFAEKLLIVSARLKLDRRAMERGESFGDGCITGRGTFQKFFDQQELRHWIERTLESAAVAAAPGVFYVFRDDQVRSGFLAGRCRRGRVMPHSANAEDLYNAHRRELEPFVRFVGERGRLPYEDEIGNASEVVEAFGSINKAFRIVVAATGKNWAAQAKRDRTQDLIVYLALSQFDGRPRFGRLSTGLQRDVRALFGSYRKACRAADELLFSLGEPEVRDAACRRSSVGKLTPSALYMHISAFPHASPILRLYEGCARGYLGTVEEATLIKLCLGEPRVAYLSYPDFDSDPHPSLASTVTVNLQTLQVRSRNYARSLNRPILHRKELFVSPNYPGYDKFARLTRIEKSKGLYEDSSLIGFTAGWNEILAKRGLCFRGHRLLRSKGSCQDSSRV